MAGLGNGNNGGLGGVIPGFGNGGDQNQPNPFNPFDPGDPDPADPPITLSDPLIPTLTSTSISIATPLPISTTLTSPTLTPTPSIVPTPITTTAPTPVPIVTVTSYFSPSTTPSATPTLNQSSDLSDNSGSFFQNKGLMTGVFTVAGLLGAAFVVGLIFLCIRRRRARKMDREIAQAAIIDRNLRFPFDEDRDEEKYSNAPTTHYQEDVTANAYMQQNRNYGAPSTYSQPYSIAPSSSEWYPTSSAGYGGGGGGAAAPQDSNYGVPPLPSAYANRPLPNPFPVPVPGGPDMGYATLGAANYDSHQYPVLPQRQATGDYHPVALRPGAPSSPSSSEQSSSQSSAAPVTPKYQTSAQTNSAMPLVAGVRRYSQAQGLQYLEDDPQPDTPNPFGDADTRGTTAKHSTGEIRPLPPIRAASVASVNVHDNEDYGGYRDLKVVNE